MRNRSHISMDPQRQRETALKQLTGAPLRQPGSQIVPEATRVEPQAVDKIADGTAGQVGWALSTPRKKRK